MRRTPIVLCLALLLGAIAAVPAAADVESNPNVVVFGPAVCENGLTFEAVYSPTDPSVVGQDGDSNIVGVGKTIWFADGDGNKVELLTRPIPAGLQRLTVFCWWPFEGSPTGFVGGDILFREALRN